MTAVMAAIRLDFGDAEEPPEEEDESAGDGDVQAADAHAMDGSRADELVFEIVQLRIGVAEDESLKQGMIVRLPEQKASGEKMAGFLREPFDGAGSGIGKDLRAAGVGDAKGSQRANGSLPGGEIEFAGVHGAGGALENSRGADDLSGSEAQD